MSWLDHRLVRIEQRRRIVEPWTISAKRHSVGINTSWWDGYDWSRFGEEWTGSPESKEGIATQYLEKHIPAGAEVVEIGPGGGRWTELLLRRARSVVAVDISETVLNVCRSRFASAKNVAFLLGNGNSIDLPSASVDAVWSFDVFVHINPNDTRRYFQEIARVLRPAGRAVIHHPGNPAHAERRRAGWRSAVTDDLVDMFARASNLHIIDRTTTFVNPGDSLTVFERLRDT